MKTSKINVLCLLTTICVIAACSKEIDTAPSSVVRGDITFEAECADNTPACKTTLDSADVLWEPGDKICVYQGALASGVFTSTATEVSKKCQFTGSLTVVIGEIESDPGQTEFWGVYPSSAAGGCDGSSVTITVNDVQQAAEGTFASGMFPSVAKSSGFALGFYNVCGGIKFTVSQSGIQKVVLRGTKGENLAGKVKVSFVDGRPAVNELVEGKDSIIVNAPTTDGFTPGKSYFLVALPASLNEGFSIEYANRYCKTTFSTSSVVQIKRNIFGVLEEKDRCGIVFHDNDAKAACVEKFDTNGDGEVSFEEAAAASTLEALFENHETVRQFPELEYFTSVRDLKGCFTACTLLTQVDIPSFITTLGEKSFYGCSSLCDIVIPANVTTIGKNVFGSEKMRIILKSVTPPSIDAESFGADKSFYVPDEAVSTYKGADVWKDFAEHIFPVSEFDSGEDLSAGGTANSYIVKKSGKYKFNAMVKGNSTQSVGTPSTACVLWESFGTSTAPSVGSIINSVELSDGHVMFSTPSTLVDGNAAIAVKDLSGNILWSWHIWVCKDFNPVMTSQSYNNDAGIMMDRNLGATSAAKGDVHALGLIYQWGRKDPFMGANSILGYMNPAASTLSWPSAVSSDSSTGTIEYTIANPTTFITYNEENSDWYYTGTSSTDNTRWQTSDKTKGMYDPCPPGWRVPDGGSNGVWVKAFGTAEWWETASNWDKENRGMDFAKTDKTLGTGTIWYPAAGYYDERNAALYDTGARGYYWSCSPQDELACRLTLESNGTVFQAACYRRATGQSVRCVKDSE